MRLGAREVLATYTVQEFSMELVITLPSNHPLGPIGVESNNHMGVTQTQWRNWLLQMTTFLSHQVRPEMYFLGIVLHKHRPGTRFNIMILSNQYRDSHYKDETVVRPSYLYNGNSYTGKKASFIDPLLYWTSPITLEKLGSFWSASCIFPQLWKIVST